MTTTNGKVQDKMNTDTIVRVDPKTLLVGPNVRKDVMLSKGFVASIKELGVRVPISAYASPDGLVVIDGQRRTLAAVDAGLESVPVFVMEAIADADRIIDQVVVNEQRQDLTYADALTAVRELTLFDLKAPAIAKKAGLDRKFVDQAVRIAASTAATGLVDKVSKEVPLDLMVRVAEFDEFPDEQAQMIELINGGRGWEADRLADRLLGERETKAVEEQITAAGLTLIKDPSYSTTDPRRIRELFVDELRSKPLEDLTHEELVDVAGDGLCAYAGTEYVEGRQKVVVKYAVKGWKERGLFTYPHYDDRQVNSKPTTPAEIEAAKVERRAARETTKAWVAATAARVEFLQELVQRRTPPAGWEKWVGVRLLTNDTFPNNGWRMAIAILQLKESADSYSMRGVVAKHFDAKPTAAAQIMLAAALGAIEGGFEFDRKGWQQSHTKSYLEQLVLWGYQLTEVEGQVA